MESNEDFATLIETAMRLTREGCDRASGTPDFADAMKLIASKKARLRLVIEFNPLPCVAAQIVGDDDGELIGELFQLQARVPLAN